MTSPQRPPRDNIVRAIRNDTGLEFRSVDDAEDGSIGTLSGHFSVFDAWYEVDSVWEGHFIERIAPGAFKKTFSENRDGMRVTFNHGQDPQLGDKVLGPIARLEEDATGAAYEVPLFDTSYNRDLLPGLKAGVYGASFRFRVVKEEFERDAKESSYNPQGLPERTIKEVSVSEFGPVTFPASAAASANVRSLTDVYAMREFTRDPEKLAALIESIRSDALPAPEPVPATPTEVEPLAADPPPEAASIERNDPPEGGTQENPVEYITREEKVARVEELKRSIAELAVAHDGELPAEAQVQWDAETKEQDDLERKIAAWDLRQARIAGAAEEARSGRDTGRVAQGYAAPTVIRKVDNIYDIAEIRSHSRTDEEFRQGLRDNAMRSVEGARFPHPNVKQDEARTQVANLLDHKDSPDKELAARILRTGNPVYQRAFTKLASGQHLTPEEDRAAAIAVVGTTTTGGYSVPYVFDPTIIHTGAYTNINPFRAICRVEQIVGGNVWRGVSAGSITAQYRAEGAAMEEGGPTFALPTYTAQRADAFVTLSREALQDRPDLASELASIIDEGKATNEEAQFAVGVGTTVYPHGMFVKSKFTVKETITDNVFAVADLDATEAALPIRHRPDAVWGFSRAVIRIIQGWETAYGKLFNSTIGYPAVGNPAQNPGGNTGLSLLGYPVYEFPSAPVTVTGDDTIVGILVSPKNYIIVDRVGMDVEIVPNLFDATTGFPTGQRGLMAIWRNTAGPVNADAGRQVNIN